MTINLDNFDLDDAYAQIIRVASTVFSKKSQIEERDNFLFHMRHDLKNVLDAAQTLEQAKLALLDHYSQVAVYAEADDDHLLTRDEEW